MSRARRLALRALAGVALLAVVALAAALWGVPALILAQLRARTDGHVSFDRWWVDGGSAGVTGLTLRAGPEADAPVLARVGVARTDLGLASLIRGRWSPRSIALERLEVDLGVDPDGRPRLPVFHPAEDTGATLSVRTRDARVTVRQDGRPALEVASVSADAVAEAGGIRVDARAVDPHWGRWAGGFAMLRGEPGVLTLRSLAPVVVHPERASGLPFVPPETWDHVRPAGPMDVSLAVEIRPDAPPEPRLELVSHGATISLPTLGITPEAVEGRALVADRRVRIEQATGRALGGRLRVDGTVDFATAPPSVSIALGLEGVNVAEVPKSWQLDELAATGKLTGAAELRVRLEPGGPDFTGSTGKAVVLDGSIQGIPVKSLGLEMSAQGSDLRYEAPDASAHLFRAAALSAWLVAAQEPKAQPDAPAAAEEPKDGPKVRGLKSLSTRIELEDVDLKLLLDRLQALTGLAPTFPIAGRLSVKAKATIPLGTLRDLRAYSFSGEASLARASIAGVDLGRLDAALDLTDGVLALRDFRGRLVERPDGDAAHPPEPLEPPPADGPLPPGGFRGTLRAELAPRGQLEARFEGEALPLAELAAPALPRPTPLRGRATIDLAARAAVESLGDVRAWVVRGRLKAGEIAWRDRSASAVEARFALENGQAQALIDSASLAGKPLGGTAELLARWPEEPGLPVPGTLRLARVDLGAIAGLVPGGLAIDGRADGLVTFTAPRDGNAWSGDVQLTAPGLRVQGLDASAVQAALQVDDAVLTYDLAADSLGGKIRFRGAIPLDPDAPRPDSDGQVQAADVALGPLLAALQEGASSALEGRAAIRANVRFADPPPPGAAPAPGGPGRGSGLYARGNAEVRALAWGPGFPLGGLKGEVALTPTWWRLDRVEGDLLGGRASGSAWSQSADSSTPGPGPGVGLELRVDQAELARLLASVPELAAAVRGRAQLVANGRVAPGVRLSLDLNAPRGTIAGVPFSEVRLPAEVVVLPGNLGTFRSRRWSARVAGGRASGELRVDFGVGRELDARVQLADLELETVSRLDPEFTRPASGRVSGRVTLHSSDSADPGRYRGRIDLVLTDASLFSLPVFRQLERFLGAARGGVFEEGELTASIANRNIQVERLALAGRIAQLHVSGTVGFDGRLQLDVLVNTNQIIPQTGQALIGLIPGLREVLGRREEAVLRVGNFLSNRLLKIRVGGTIRSPTVQVDPAVLVTDAAIGFFGSTLGLPLNLLR